MPAKAQIYKDAECTIELTSVNGTYIDDYGQPIDGQDNTYQRWVKNTGDIVAPALVLTEVSDPRGYVLYSTDGVSWSNNCVLGDLAVGQIKTFFVKIAPPLGATEAADVQAYYRISNF